MNVGELKCLLEHVNDTKEVTIIVSKPGSIGATPHVKIRDAGIGIDWDGHMFMLYPEKPLIVKREEEKWQEAPQVK
jgi:hypothetical protein